MESPSTSVPMRYNNRTLLLVIYPSSWLQLSLDTHTSSSSTYTHTHTSLLSFQINWMSTHTHIYTSQSDSLWSILSCVYRTSGGSSRRIILRSDVDFDGFGRTTDLECICMCMYSLIFAHIHTHTHTDIYTERYIYTHSLSPTQIHSKPVRHSLESQRYRNYYHFRF